MTIKDFIGQINSEVDTTINIIDFKTKNNSLKQIMNTIVTSSIQGILKEGFEAIADQMIRTGNSAAFQSFLIEGNFGSGKSHLLSAINTLFDDSIDSTIRDHLWERMRETFGDEYLELKDKKFLVVPISLHGHLQADLIDIIFREIEKILFEKLEKSLKISSPSKIIDFYNNCRQGIKDEIETIISSDYDDLDLERFNDLDEADNSDFYRKAEIIRECMEKINIKIDDTYKIGDSIEKFLEVVLKETLSQLDEEVIINEEIEFEGIILLVDEFSEYLKSQRETERDEKGRKRTLASLQIQYIAEFIRDKNFFIFIAQQEVLYSLDPLFQKQSGSGGRLKKLNLDHFHFVDIFNQIILPEKGNFRVNIENLFPTLSTQYFGSSKYSIYKPKNPEAINTNIFYECYPFHPKTFDLLIDHVYNLSTKTRAGLSYVSSYLQDSLDNENLELLTPDTLFDFFKKEIYNKERKKYIFIRDLIRLIQADQSFFTDEETVVNSKILKYIYLTESQVTADDCIIDLFLDYDEEDLEKLLNRLVDFSKESFQISYLRRKLDPSTNIQNFLLQERGSYDIEDMVHILSHIIQDSEIHSYFINKVYNKVLNKGAIGKIKYKQKDWQIVDYFTKFEVFQEVLDDAADNIRELPSWNAKEIEFYELYICWNLPFREEYNYFTEGEITRRFREVISNSPNLEHRMIFFRVSPFSDLLISEIKRCLAFDLLNRRFADDDANWHGYGDLQQEILVGNDELLHQINNYYHENVQENKEDIHNEISVREQEYSLDRGAPTHNKIEEHFGENTIVINATGAIDIGERDEIEIKRDIIEDVINCYYPDFPEFLRDTDKTQYINIILGELSKDNRTFEIDAGRLTQVNGMVVTEIGLILGIFSDVEMLPSGNRVFKIGLREDNIFYTRVMELIPAEEEADGGTAGLLSISRLCETLYEEFGFSLNISRIFLATLLNQDKIKVTNRQKTQIFNNLDVKKVITDSLRRFNQLFIFKTKRLSPNEINWIFNFFNGLFDDLEEYRNAFTEEINNLEELEDLKTSKQQKLKKLFENYNLEEIDNINEKLEDLYSIFDENQEEGV